MKKARECDGYLGGDCLSCGNKKWCLSGVCTFSESAPTKDENCMFGDYIYSFFHDEYYRYYGYYGYNGRRTLQCKGRYDTVEKSPDLCKFEDIRRRCCDTSSPYYRRFLGIKKSRKTTIKTTTKSTMKTTTKSTVKTTTRAATTSTRKTTLSTTSSIASIPTATFLPTHASRATSHLPISKPSSTTRQILQW